MLYPAGLVFQLRANKQELRLQPAPSPAPLSSVPSPAPAPFLQEQGGGALAVLHSPVFVRVVLEGTGACVDTAVPGSCLGLGFPTASTPLLRRMLLPCERGALVSRNTHGVDSWSNGQGTHTREQR